MQNTEKIKEYIQKTIEKIVKNKIATIFIETTIILIIFSLLSLIKITIIQKIAFSIFGIWAIMFIALIINMTIKTSEIKINKKLYIYLFIVIILCMCLYFGIIYNTKQIYTWDQCCYYNNQIDLLNNFDVGFLKGISKIIQTTYKSDYGYFLLSFTSLIFSFTKKTETSFIIVFAITEIIPVVLVLLLNIINISKKTKNKNIFLLLSALTIFATPLLHKAAITGQPDIFGLFWVGIIILLTTDYNFEKKEITRWSLIIISSFLLAITRRWYIFWMIGYYLAYGITILIEAILKKDKKILIKKIKNISIFATTSVIILAIALFPIIYNTIIAQYSVSYSFWNIGGISFEIKQQISFLGYLAIGLILIGIVYAVYKKNTRKIILTNLIASIIIIITFTRIQNAWYHQSLIYVPQYIILIIMGLRAICQIENKNIRNTLTILSFAYLITATYGSIGENQLFFNNKLYSNISIKPVNRKDYNEIGKMVEYIKENCVENGDKVYPNFASSEYCGHTLMQYLMPENTLEEIVYYESSIDGVHGFPIGIFESKYIIIANKIIDETGATKSKIIPDINNAILKEEGIKNKFKKVQEFDMNNGIVFSFYQRIEKIDKEEAEKWKKIVKEQNSKYPDKFENRINEYVNSLNI